MIVLVRIFICHFLCNLHKYINCRNLVKVGLIFMSDLFSVTHKLVSLHPFFYKHLLKFRYNSTRVVKKSLRSSIKTFG